MARYTGPKNKLSRREGIDLFGTGGRSLERRLSIPPGGMHRRRRKPSDYGLQLREKQKVKRMYGLLERQFRHLFEQASRGVGVTGTRLLQLLEQRLDNVVYRLGFARTRLMARQMVNHGHVLVDGRKVDVASYRVMPGQTVRLTEAAMKMPVVEELLEDKSAYVPDWLQSTDRGAGRMTRLPERNEMDAHISEELIVEFYSR
ncbi:MAG: 30S ribosomal protein S4 [Chloroflexota bacterium]|nr:MAG: 30S ribosomal protein S4 [Chloroflexota bacterium]